MTDTARVAGPDVRVRPDARLTAALAAVGAVAVGAAIQVADGYGRPAAFAWLSVAVVAVLLAVVAPTHRAVEGVLRHAAPTLLVGGLVGQLAALLRTPPAPPFAAVAGWQATFLVAAVGVAVAAFAVAWLPRAFRAVGVAGIVGIHLALGIWTIGLQPAPVPPIDVYVFQRDAVAALLAGVNPYAITFANPYPDGTYYGPGMVADGRLTFGFVYPPLSAYLSTAGWWVGGDVRYAQLGAMTLAALLMATVRPGPLGPLAAALYLFTPRNLFVLQQSWTEPFVVLFLAATVWCAARSSPTVADPATTRPPGTRWGAAAPRRILPVALGLFLAVKQYAVLGLPLVLLLARPPLRLAGAWRTVLPAGVVAAAVTAPLALGALPGFWRAVVTLQFDQPFRPEALSYLGLLAGPVLPGAPPPAPPFGPGVAFAAAAAVGGLALWRAARTPAGFALGVAALFLAFFVLNKQAFANYYFFVVGALCVAVAATDPTDPKAPKDPGDRGDPKDPADRWWRTGRRAGRAEAEPAR